MPVLDAGCMLGLLVTVVPLRVLCRPGGHPGLPLRCFLHSSCAAGSAACLWLELPSVTGDRVRGFSAPRVGA